MADQNSIPRGFCQCGCGQQTAICDRNWKRFGYVKGEPFKFIPSHNRRINGRGYKHVRVNSDSVCEHVLVAEQVLGRKLPKGSAVHHVDGNHRNNTKGNLVICESAAYHNLLHARARVVAAGGDPNTAKLCRKCNGLKGFSEFSKGHTECRSCAALAFRKWSEAKRTA